MSSNPVAVRDGAEVDIDSVAAAVRACPGVDDLAAGRLASVATYLPGRQVAGLRVEPDRVTVQVRGRWNVPVAEVASEIRAALAPLVGTRVVDVALADVADPAEPAALTPSTSMPPQLPTGGSVETWRNPNAGVKPSVGSSSATTIPTAAETPTNS
ncbi:hypothetical protein [Jatrophihabitans lederbergiae]|uniref:Asp23/Gls24 family envelope stress response protein n=1 Tax=Jatrophihabitans lederbergiae TaxID=3075547 RepID=A0ABU2J654_9ACTN|nr:hypothetical protein [Jatrophihabitans sp. DSM 44399]MDT0260472.1 hypothetical protein [Jatrophihabitans sp. DSM 44399]